MERVANPCALGVVLEAGAAYVAHAGVVDLCGSGCGSQGKSMRSKGVRIESGNWKLKALNLVTIKCLLICIKRNIHRSSGRSATVIVPLPHTKPKGLRNGTTIVTVI